MFAQSHASCSIYGVHEGSLIAVDRYSRLVRDFRDFGGHKRGMLLAQLSARQLGQDSWVRLTRQQPQYLLCRHALDGRCDARRRP